MGKQISSPKLGVPVYPGILPVSKGGTGGGILGGVLKTQAGSVSGVFQISQNNDIPASVVPDSIAAPVTISGSTSVVLGASTSFTITNYDKAFNYSISVSEGTYNRVNETITVTLPNSISSNQLILTVNSREIVLSVTSAGVVKPSIVSPLNLSGNHGSSVSFTSSAFAVTSASDVHDYSDWQISLQSDFSTLAFQVTASSGNKINYVPSGLLPSTTYYVRVRHHGTSNGYSDWSDPISIVTIGELSNDSLYQSIPESYSTYQNTINSLSVSKDGNVLLVAKSETYNTYQGAILVYVKSANVWQLRQTIRTMETVGQSAVSYDGKVLIVTEQFGRSIKVYLNSSPSTANSTWSAVSGTFPSFGTNTVSSISISDHTDPKDIVCAIGVPGDYNFVQDGRVYLYWTTNPSNANDIKLNTYVYNNQIDFPGLPNSNYKGVGHRVDVSSDATYVAVSCTDSYSHDSSVHVFTFDKVLGQCRTRQLHIVEDKDYGTSRSICLSTNGSVLAVSERVLSSGNYVKAIKIYHRSGSTWTLADTIVSTDNTNNGVVFGHDMCLSSDGVYLYASYPQAYNQNGAVYIYKNVSGSYELISTITRPDSVTYFGQHLELSEAVKNLVVSTYSGDYIHSYL